MADERHIVVKVECPLCKTKQKVHVSASTGGVQMGDHMIQCIRCNNHFKVRAPDKIIRGPFPA